MASLSHPSRRSVLSALLAMAGASPLAALADPAQETKRRSLDTLESATVGIEVQVVDGAASVRTLGARRQGSGVLVEPHGLVLTIGYLVLEAERVQLVTREQRRVPAQVVAYDAVTGLGLLRPLIPLPAVRPVPLGRAADLLPGSPLLFVTGDGPRESGVVRLADARPFTGYWEYHLERGLYTTPPVAAHSGAGLFNAAGELVGIGNLLMPDVMREDQPEVRPGNLFVPVDVLVPVLEDLLRTGVHPQARRPWMGVNALTLAGRVRITRVTPGSPAQDAGLRPGDWITAVDGQPVGTAEALFKQVWAHGMEAGPVRLTVREAGQERVLELPVRERASALARPRGI